jgi:transcription-repair coupling factor (superfamily II helicase)
LSQDVIFKKLGLLVVDEEQRFGVDHKEKIKAAYPAVDVLTLSATPIPRTLHMAMSGIRDISVLEEPPHDRRPVQTYVMEYDEGIMTEAILRELARKGQVFYLFNDTRRILEKATQLEKLLPGARITVAHGKMSEKRLEEVIEDFIEGNADVLVCTTIIESGIDMPHVNTIIIEDADRLGLAQLYQLRGRVGRSDRQAFAYVTYRRDKILTEVAEKRLAAIRDFTELGAGFKIALRDLEVRGAGNLLGGEQHGHLDAIGYDLYCKMLDEAIHELQGQAIEKAVAATIDLSIDAFIPKSYIPDEGQRMDMYRRLAAISTPQDYTDAMDELADRYGDLPEAVGWLLDIALIRASASRHGFAKVEAVQDNFVLTYADIRKPDMELLSGLLGAAAFKGRILFNAGNKPYLVFRGAAKSRPEWTRNLRWLFAQLDQLKSGQAS